MAAVPSIADRSVRYRATGGLMLDSEFLEKTSDRTALSTGAVLP